jgi:transcriptional regulator with XRE-family HTH domain
LFVPHDDTSAAVVGRVLREAREQAGVTQQDVALRTRMDRAYLSEVENGKRSLSIDRLLRICRAIDVKAATVVARIERQLEAS